MTKTKIIATLGPSSNTESVLREMFIPNLDTVRLNFSHGTYEEHLSNIKLIHDLNKELKRNMKIMQDLEGYRIRIGKLKKSIHLKKGTEIYLTQRDTVGNKNKIPFDYNGSLKDIKKDTLIYIDDGKIILKVKKVEKRNLKTEVIGEGKLKDYKGINIPDLKLDFKVLTDKDRQDVKVAIDHKLDYVAQSFVGKAKDIKMLKDIIEPKHPQCKIFAKVENRQAIKNIDEIIDEADGVIIARGDLGISIPIYKVPVVQKEIIKKCHQKNKPVMVATQMLDSMIEEDIPTRAEVSDVANAILDGATHLLLSGETAIGKHPPKVIKMMDDIIKYTQRYQNSSFKS